jgi:hypothetical protein
MSKSQVSLFVVLLTASVVRSDLPVPGHRKVQMDHFFDNLDEHPGFTFYAYPVGLDMTWQKVEPGKAVWGNSESMAEAMAGGFRIFAVPKAKETGIGGGPLGSWFGGREPGVLSSDRTLRRHELVPIEVPLSTVKVSHHWRVEVGSELRLQPAEEATSAAPVDAGASGQRIPPATRFFLYGVPATAFVALAVLLGSRLRRRAVHA